MNGVPRLVGSLAVLFGLLTLPRGTHQVQLLALKGFSDASPETGGGLQLSRAF